MAVCIASDASIRIDCRISLRQPPSESRNTARTGKVKLVCARLTADAASDCHGRRIWRIGNGGDCMQAQYRALAVLTVIGLLAAPRGPLPAAQPAAGTTSRQARDEATRAMPLSKIPAPKRSQVATIVNGSTLFRRMPTQVIECDPSFYTFMVENPDVIVSVWRASASARSS